MLKIILTLSITAIFFTGFVGFRYAGGPNDNAYDVEYKVVCDQCYVTYRNEKGQSAEIATVKKDWTYKFTGNPGQFVYVSATNDKGKPVSVLIKRGGQLMIDGTSDQRDKDARAGLILEP